MPVSLTAYRLVGDRYAEVGTGRPPDVAVLDEPFTVEIDMSRIGPAPEL